MNYYNEFDPNAAAWLRELIAQGLIPAGIVDTRSITEIQPHELKPFIQCHFFAGIGGWSLALQLAGWPATRPVWTGSCPCQPFSTAGKQLGQADERHLWPVFFNLIRECRPDVVFGEQVAAAIGKGWLDGVSADLEGAGYACGSAVIGAHSVGSPHIRQRLYWMADAMPAGERWKSREGYIAADTGGMADATGERGGPRGTEREGQQRTPSHGGVGCRLADATRGQCEQRLRPQGDVFQRPADYGATGRLGNASGQGLEERGDGIRGALDLQRQAVERAGAACGVEHAPLPQCPRFGQFDIDLPGSANPWSRFDLIPCADGKARRIEPGLAPLAHGVPARVVRLRGYGNAIVPQVAAEFVGAYLDTQNT